MTGFRDEVACPDQAGAAPAVTSAAAIAASSAHSLMQVLSFAREA